MFTKLKNKLRIKLIEWLEIDKLGVEVDCNSKYINKLTNRVHLTEKDIYNNKKYTNEELKELDNKYDSLHRTIQATVSMGADIRFDYRRIGSWAVVCFNRGNTPIVKFIDLNGNRCDGRQIYDFLRQFDASNYKIDSPMGYFGEDMFYMWDK